MAKDPHGSSMTIRPIRLIRVPSAYFTSPHRPSGDSIVSLRSRSPREALVRLSLVWRVERHGIQYESAAASTTTRQYPRPYPSPMGADSDNPGSPRPIPRRDLTDCFPGWLAFDP